jgi:CheY-like chemotaxis protein
MLPAALFVSAITQSSDMCHSDKNEVCEKIDGTACRRGGMHKLQPVRILVVDDYEPWRQWVSSLLSQQEHLQLVAEVSHGLEAVQKIVLLKPDLILLDINLPSLNGIEVAREISKSAHSVKIVYVSNEIHADVVNAALSNGAFGYVAKADAGTELLLSNQPFAVRPSLAVELKS